MTFVIGLRHASVYNLLQEQSTSCSARRYLTNVGLHTWGSRYTGKPGIMYMDMPAEQSHEHAQDYQSLNFQLHDTVSLPVGCSIFCQLLLQVSLQVSCPGWLTCSWMTNIYV